MSKIRMVEQASAPGTPGTNEALIYFDSSGNLCFKREDGSVCTIAGTGTLTYVESTWTPAITGSAGNPTVTYTESIGRYTRVGNVVYYYITITIATYSGGSGDARISLPITVGTSYQYSACMVNGVDLPGTPIDVAAVTQIGQAYLHIDAMQDNASSQRVAVGALAAGDSLYINGFYFV